MAKGKYEYWLTDDGLLLLQGWARDGLSQAQIAKNMGVSLTTLKEYIKTYPTISTTIKKGRSIVIYEIENALIREALNGNVTAQIFALKNLNPKNWRDKPEINENEKDLQSAREIIVSVRRAATDEYQDRTVTETD